MRALFAIAGLYHLALGVIALGAPRRFYDDVASFGPYNEHFIRDVGGFYLALGVGLLVAAARPSWRQPVLVVVVIEYVIHVIQHIFDVADAEKDWQGPLSLIALAAIGVALWWLLQKVSRGPASRESGAEPRPRPPDPSSRA